jgi:hypothetical protein
MAGFRNCRAVADYNPGLAQIAAPSVVPVAIVICHAVRRPLGQSHSQKTPLKHGGTEEAEVAQILCFTPASAHSAYLVKFPGLPSQRVQRRLWRNKPEVTELVSDSSCPPASLRFLRSSVFQRFWPVFPEFSLRPDFLLPLYSCIDPYGGNSPNEASFRGPCIPSQLLGTRA